jgi:glutathione reductase (NADPH)
LGAEVVQAYRGDLFMRGFDDDIRQFLAQEVRKTGVDLRFNTNPKSIETHPRGYKVVFEDDTETEVDAILCATGRRPNIADLNLECTSVTLSENGFIAVNEEFQTTEASVYALGDLIGGEQLTPVALAEGMAFAHREFGAGGHLVDYDFIPTAVFSQPNVGTVGYTEVEAREAFGKLDIYRSEYRPMKHTLSGRDERSMMKLIVDQASQRVIGVHMVGPDAGEILQGMAIALRMGATKMDFDRTIGIHPTAAEELVTLREVDSD